MQITKLFACNVQHSLMLYHFTIKNLHQIGIMNNYPLFRVRSWNNGMRFMSFYILTKPSLRKDVAATDYIFKRISPGQALYFDIFLQLFLLWISNNSRSALLKWKAFVIIQTEHNDAHRLIYMACCETAVTPLLTHGSYCSLALNCRYSTLQEWFALHWILMRFAMMTSSNGHRWIPLT